MQHTWSINVESIIGYVERIYTENDKIMLSVKPRRESTMSSLFDSMSNITLQGVGTLQDAGDEKLLIKDFSLISYVLIE